MLLLSRQPKYESRASQHFDRCVRSGAIGAPSEDILGGGGDADGVLKNPIVGIESLRGVVDWTRKRSLVQSVACCNAVPGLAYLRLRVTVVCWTLQLAENQLGVGNVLRRTTH